MSPSACGILALVSLLVLIVVRVPIGLALILTAFVGNAFFLGIHPAITQFQLIIWEEASNFILVTLPLFIWMGQLAHHCGLGRDLYGSLHKWMGRTRGGLAVTAIFSSAGFGAISGSSVATVMTMGKMLAPEMRRYGYDQGLSAGSLAAAGVLAILIPPSIPLVFYGAWTETSIGDLFAAGIIPGLLLTLFFSIYVLVHCALKPKLAPQGAHYSWRDKLYSLPYLFFPLLILGAVFGSIYAGLATPTEAAAVGVASVLVVGAASRRLTRENLRHSLSQSARLSSNIFLLLLGGVFFSRFMVQTGLTQDLIAAIAGAGLSPSWVLVLLVVMYLILGAFLDTFGMIILTLPFVFPLIISLGYDPVWFGVFLVMMIELALITPPIGINVFVMQRIVPATPLAAIYRGTLPFIGLTLLLVACLVAFPSLALWLPAHMKH